MKLKKFTITLVSIFILLILTTPFALAQEYTWNISIGEEFIWKVDLIDQDALNTTFGMNWEEDLESEFGIGAYNLNATKKYKFININSTSKYWYLDFDIWHWTTSNFAEVSDISDNIPYQTFEGTYPYLGPWGKNVYFSPLDVDQYLCEYDANENRYNVNNSWVYNEDDLTNYSIIYTFNRDTGVLSKAEIKNENEEVIYQFSIQSGGGDNKIPFSNIFVIITLFSLTTVAFFIRKKIKIQYSFNL
ncbi:MAG: hypothetical protein ACQERB_00700 [Promethearchaeati archaeon]